MFKFKYYIHLLLCLALFTGCEEEVVLDFGDYQQSLAVFSLFTPNNVITNDGSFTVEVSSTQSILDNSDFQFIDDAVVTITSNVKDNPVEPVEERLTSATNFDDKLVYVTDLTVPQGGFEYELRIDHPDFASVTARSFIPPVTEITNIEFDAFKESRENELPGFTRFYTNLEIEFPNNANQDDFFHLIVWLRFRNVWSPVNNRFEDRWRPINLGSKILQEQLGTDAIVVNVGDSPVFFGAHFSDEQFSGTSQNINVDISFLLTDSEDPSDIKVELRSVSREYHRYFVDGFRLSQAGDNPFFVNSNNITNNIEGGFGVFAGFIASDVDISLR